MSREVDERIVAMYFDNKDFEKNAQSTIKTLDELKKGLDLEGAAKGLDTLQKAGKTLNFDRANQSVRTFRNTLDGLGSVMKKSFSGITAPLDAIEGAFNSFRGYVGKVVGFDIAGKLVGGIENALREVTIEPVTAGWNEYELKMDSIKTIMSGTTESYTKMRQEAESGWVYEEGEHLEYVKQNLEELNRYADKTIYSFADMTANIGKFTNQGVELESATSAIKGIANAAADAGQGAQQASMAMYNISQALGVGSMKLVDWKSIENANMATARLKNTFLQMGGALGQLKKYTDKEGNIHYFAYDDNTKAGKQKQKLLNEKKISGMTKAELDAYLKKNNLAEVTAENFRESLNENWLDKEVLLKTLQVFSGDELDMDTIMSWGFDEEQARELMKIGEEASKAATEVRTFTKMWDALKEAAQSGWAQSMEYIFGDMQEGTALWTRLNDIFGEMLNSSAENRNNVLLAWRGLERQEDGSVKGIEGAIDGRERLIDGVMQIIYLFQDLGRAFNAASEEVFGSFTGEKLLEMTEGFRTFAFQIRNWFGVVSSGESRLAKLRRGLQGVFNILKTGANAIKIVADLMRRMAGPAIDVLIDMFAQFGDFFDGMGKMSPSEVFKKIADGLNLIWTKLRNLFTVGSDGTAPISGYLKNLWTDLKNVIKTWADENGLGGMLDGVKGVWSTITGWNGWTGIANAFHTAKEAVSGAWRDISEWDGWSEIGQFFTNIWDWFTKKTVSGDTSPTQSSSELKAATDSTVHALKETGESLPADGKTGFVIWLEQVAASLSSAWNAIATWEGWPALGKFFSDIGKWIADSWGVMIDWFTKPTESGKTGFIEWLEGIRDKLTGAWNTIVSWPFWGNVGNFFGDIGNWLKQKAQVTIDWFSQPTEDGKTGFITWLEGIGSFLSEAWKGITEWPKWEEIGQFLNDTWGWVTGLFGGGAAASADEAPKKAGEAKEALEETVKMAPDEKSVSLLERIMTAMKGFWTSVTEFTNSIGTDPAVTKIWELVGKTMEIIGRVLEVAIGLLHSAVVAGDPLAWTAIIGIIGLISGVSAASSKVKLTGLKHMATIAENSQSFGLQLLEIAGAVALISAAVAGLSMLDEDAVNKAIGKIGIIAGIMAALSGAAWAFRDKTGNDDKPVTSWERLGQSVIKYAGVMGVILVAMKELPGVIGAIGQLGQTGYGKDILDTLTGTMGLIGGIMAALAIVQRIAPKGIDPIATAKTVLSVMEAIGITMGIFMAGGGILELLDGLVDRLAGDKDIDTVGAAVGAIEKLGDVLNALAVAMSGFLMGLFGVKTENNKQREVGDQLEWLAEISGKMDITKMTKIGSLMGLVERISTLRVDGGTMDLIAGMMPDVGSGLAKFAANLVSVTDGDDGSQRVENLLGMVHVLEAFADAVVAVNDVLLITNYGTGMNFQSIFGEDNLPRLYDLYTKAAEMLADSVQKGLGEDGDITFNATPIVDSIIAAIGLGDEAIATAVHNMVQSGLNFADAVESYEPPKQTGSETEDFVSMLQGLDGMTFDFSGINESLFGQNGLETIMTNFENSIPDLQEMFNSKGWNMVDKNGAPIDLTSELAAQLGTVQESLQELPAFEVKITPVFNMDEMGKQNLQDLLNRETFGIRMPGATISANFDSGAIVTAVQGVSSRIDGLMARVTTENIMNRTTMQQMGERIDGIAGAVRQMKVVLDSGVLVGEIAGQMDYNLGARVALTERTGVSPKWGGIAESAIP